MSENSKEVCRHRFFGPLGLSTPCDIFVEFQAGVSAKVKLITCLGLSFVQGLVGGRKGYVRCCRLDRFGQGIAWSGSVQIIS